MKEKKAEVKEVEGEEIYKKIKEGKILKTVKKLFHSNLYNYRISMSVVLCKPKDFMESYPEEITCDHQNVEIKVSYERVMEKLRNEELLQGYVYENEECSYVCFFSKGSNKDKDTLIVILTID